MKTETVELLGSFQQLANSIEDISSSEEACLVHRELWGMIFPQWDVILKESESLCLALLEYSRTAIDRIADIVRIHPTLIPLKDELDARTRAFACLFERHNEAAAMDSLREIAYRNGSGSATENESRSEQQ